MADLLNSLNSVRPFARLPFHGKVFTSNFSDFICLLVALIIDILIS